MTAPRTEGRFVTRGVSFLLAIAGVALPYVVGYHVDPVKAQWSGWTPGRFPNIYVSEVITCNFDSLSYVELFAGGAGNGGAYTATVCEDNRRLTASVGNRIPDHDWVRFANWDETIAFTKGKQYELRFARSDGDSIQYYYQGRNPYRYGHMRVGSTDEAGKNLCCRVYGRLSAIDSAFWGVDEWCFVPWLSSPEASRENRQRLRQKAARLAESAHVGSMMTYARWPTLLWPGDPVTRHWEDFNARLYSIVNSNWANARPVVNITEVARYVSTRVDTVLKPNGDTLFNSGYCAPRNLYEPASSDSNYWADYIRDLVTHKETDRSRRPWQCPCEVVHTWEIWNEPNDTIDHNGSTGWWRRPKEQYTRGYDGMVGLCKLYIRMASIADSVIHHQCGTEHENDTILIGASHRIFEWNNHNLIKGLDWVRTCYQIATQSGGPGIFWDGISFHPYQDAYGFDPDKFELMAESVRAVVRSFGDYDCQVWCSEVGVLYGGWNADTIAKYHQEDAERYLPQLYTTAIASQALPGARYDQCQWWWYSNTDTHSWYGLVGLRGIDLGNDSDVGGRWQQFSSDSTFQNLAQQLTGLQFERRVPLGDATKEDSARIYEFSDPEASSKRRWVGWTVEPTGRKSLTVDVKIPARTDTIVLGDSTGGQQHVLVDADGWLRHPITPRAIFVTEVGSVSRPDLRVDSVRCMQSGQVVVRAWVTNHGTRATPVRSGSRVPYPTWYVLRANGDSLAQQVRTTSLAANQQTEFMFNLGQTQLPDTVLFSVTVNPDQTYVELGTDDNTGYALVAKP